MEERNVTDEFVNLLFEKNQSELPEPVLEKARCCLMDYVGVTLGGSAENKEPMDRFLTENVCVGSCHMIGYDRTADCRTAALVNAYNSHTLELDDGHRAAMLHLAAPVFSALLSVAEERDCLLPDLLRGAVIGYEAAIRVACAIQPEHKKRGFHATGTCGAIGSAMAVAAMLNYSMEEMKNALSAAATSGAGLLEVITGASRQKPYNVVNAVSAGINAALFGKYLQGPRDVLGGSRGFLHDFSDGSGTEQMVKKDASFAIEGIYMKPYAACRHCHAPVEATLKLRGDETEHRDMESVESIHVATYGLAVYGHDHTQIDGSNSAKMSIPYSVAAAWLYGQCGLEMFREDKIHSRQLLEMAGKVRVTEDPELSVLVPEKRAAVVTVFYKGGESHAYRVDYPKGEPENPISFEELKDKFTSIAHTAGRQKEWCDRVVDGIWSKEPVKTLISK